MVGKLGRVGLGILILLAAVGGRLWANTWYTPWMSQRAIFEQNDRLVLYSITRMGASVPIQGHFNGFEVLGKKQINDPIVKARLLKALFNGLDVPEDFPLGDCFFPRYGIRATKSGRIVDAALCYSCGVVQF